MRELDLLQHIYRVNDDLPERITIRPGDDMGAVRIGSCDVLVTVDQVTEGAHFVLGETPIEKIGRKAVVRNLSDVAAMAAWPVGAVVAAVLPKGLGAEKARLLFDAMREAAREYECPLFGGDIAMGDGPLVISVTVLAEPRGVVPLLRRGARVGDIVCVTGQLGGSWDVVGGYTHHLDFQPRIELARHLASHFDLHCMIDISDGLARDLGHICRASHVTAELSLAGLPISPAAHRRAEREHVPAWRCALGDGEDYELCFTLATEQAERLPDKREGVPISRVGIITRASGRDSDPMIRLRFPDGSEQDVDELGWEHQG